MGITKPEIDMSSTYVSLHYHLVFGTKNREPLIASNGVPACTNTLAARSPASEGFRKGLAAWRIMSIFSSV